MGIGYKDNGYLVLEIKGSNLVDVVVMLKQYPHAQTLKRV